MASTYETALELLEEAPDFLGKKYVLDKRKMAFFQETCKAVDDFADAIDCEDLSVMVKNGKPNLTFVMIVDYLELDSQELMKNFKELIPTMDEISFTRAKYEDRSLVKLRIDLTISRLWNSADEQPT